MSEWTVVYYIDPRHRYPVLDFIASLPEAEQAAAARDIDLLAEFGLQAPHVRPIEGQGWELKSGSVRIFYVAYTAKRFVLLHGYYKKRQKAPAREIETAKRRLGDLLERDR